MTGMAAADMPLSSPDPCPLVNFLGFAGIAVYFLIVAYSLRDLREGQVSGHNICSMKLLGPLITMV